jgi:arabinose-5-phosphate isomerase
MSVAHTSHSQLIPSAINRSGHFASAILWIQKQLESNPSFQKNFLKLVTNLSQATRSASTSQQVFFIAVGKSAQVASLLSSMLVSVGILARFVHPTEAFHGDLGVIGSNDSVIFISNNGKSAELLQLIPGLEERHVTTFVITSKEDSPLAQACTLTLPIPPLDEMCPLNQAPITSTVTTLALGQLLVAATIEDRNFSIEDYAKNHPGGAIGKRIFLKVDHLMLKESQLPIVKPNTEFLHVVSAFTKFGKGALLVIENQKLLGLISEKDLRVNMEKHKKNVFDLKAQDLMNTKPTTISQGLLAADVKHFMTSHNPPFNILPVMNEKNEPIGLIRVLDLVEAGV